MNFAVLGCVQNDVHQPFDVPFRTARRNDVAEDFFSPSSCQSLRKISLPERGLERVERGEHRGLLVHPSSR